MRPVDRRTFLKGLGVVSAGTAASAVAASVTLPLSAALPPQRRDGPKWTKAPCRLCGVGCGLLIGTDKGRAVAVKGDADSPVSEGLGCVKGYSSVQALIGPDRITRARVRRNGAMVDVPLGDALDLVARKLREAMQQRGKDGVGLYGSAEWSITDAYVASKLFKGALGTNNVETSSRLHAGAGMAGLQSSFGLDGAIGCYEDIEHADVFVLWEANLAESDPVLFSRMLKRKRTDPAVRIIDVGTRITRTSYAADNSLLHAPHTAPAIANAICHEIVARKWFDRAFINEHVAFKRGKVDIGDGLAGGGLVMDDGTSADWGDYERFLRDYDPEHAQQWAGLSAASIRWLASLYGDPMRKVMSVWGVEASGDIRGTWLNNLLYNIHLLVGKIATPGNSPLCLTGQPSGGCAVHDAGSLTHTLPRGAVESETDRRRAADIWGVPVEQLDPKPAHHALSLFRALEGGDIRFLWILGTDPMTDLPSLGRYQPRGDRFIVVSDAYPTSTTDLADVVLPSALWLERDGIYANAERRLQLSAQVVAPPGDATSDAWQMIEVARRLGFGKLFPYEPARHVEQVWQEYAQFHKESPSILPPFAALRDQPGVQWPYANGQEVRWRYNVKEDPAADRARGELDFYGHPDHRAWIWLRPYEPAAEAPDQAYPFWLQSGAVLEHSGSGALTQRIPALHHALPHAYVELNRDDARELGIRNREMLRLVSRRGSLEIQARIDYRSQPPRGQLFVPAFDASRPIHRLMLDAYCPLSGQSDSDKCAVRVERLRARNEA
jgi:nitrate reductase NapA